MVNGEWLIVNELPHSPFSIHHSQFTIIHPPTQHRNLKAKLVFTDLCTPQSKSNDLNIPMITHRLLKRQIRKCLGEDAVLSPEMGRLLAMINGQWSMVNG